MGWTCAMAGLTASEPSAVNHKRELESRSFGLINLFISKDNPASRHSHTSLRLRLPAAQPAIAPISKEHDRKPILKRRLLCPSGPAWRGSKWRPITSLTDR